MTELYNLNFLTSIYKNANVAFQNIVVNSAFIEDEEHKEEFMQTVLAALPLNFKI